MRKTFLIVVTIALVLITGCSTEQLDSLKEEYARVNQQVQAVDAGLDQIESDIKLLRDQGHTAGPEIDKLLDEALETLGEREALVDRLNTIETQLADADDGWDVAAIGAETAAAIFGVPALGFLAAFLRARGQRDGLIRNVEISRRRDEETPGLMKIDQDRLSQANAAAGLNGVIDRVTSTMTRPGG